MRCVFTNGVFDLFHEGHMHLLARCVDLALDRALIIAINTDHVTTALKGAGRPKERWLVRSAKVKGYCVQVLGRLPEVIPLAQLTPRDMIAAIQPEILVKGSDYTEKTIVGADLVKSWGGRVVIVPRLKNISTTERVKDLVQ